MVPINFIINFLTETKTLTTIIAISAFKVEIIRPTKTGLIGGKRLKCNLEIQLI